MKGNPYTGLPFCIFVIFCLSYNYQTNSVFQSNII